MCETAKAFGLTCCSVCCCLLPAIALLLLLFCMHSLSLFLSATLSVLSVTLLLPHSSWAHSCLRNKVMPGTMSTRPPSWQSSRRWGHLCQPPTSALRSLGAIVAHNLDTFVIFDVGTQLFSNGAARHFMWFWRDSREQHAMSKHDNRHKQISARAVFARPGCWSSLVHCRVVACQAPHTCAS